MALEGGCAFCARHELRGVLAETERFFLLADHAPLVEGHLLIVPRQHFACYGALPTAYEAEFLELKRQAREFLRARYRDPIFFEHGVFRQTVPHAHLHAIPFGQVCFGVRELATAHGLRVATLADVRAWYDKRGHYFYIEEPGEDEDKETHAGVFPPEEQRYYHVLGLLRQAAGRVEGFRPPLERLASGRPKVRTLVEAWHAHMGTLERTAEEM